MDKFCPSCGAPVNANATTTRGPPSQSLSAIFNTTEYVIDHKILTLVSHYEIKDNSEKLLANMVLVPVEFTLEDPTGILLARVQKKVMWSFDKPAWESYDSQGQLISSVKMVKEKPPGALLPRVYPHLLDGKGEEIGRFAHVGNPLSGNWVLTSPDGSTVAELNLKELPRIIVTIKILNTIREPYVIFIGLLQTLEEVLPPPGRRPVGHPVR